MGCQKSKNVAPGAVHTSKGIASNESKVGDRVEVREGDEWQLGTVVSFTPAGKAVVDVDGIGPTSTWKEMLPIPTVTFAPPPPSLKSSISASGQTTPQKRQRTVSLLTVTGIPISIGRRCEERGSAESDEDNEISTEGLTAASSQGSIDTTGFC
eukprot:Sspe_Gene.10013::Locus_3361_Transcript_1_1_Confidence_1.000_Length_591::g.10013::m.10013